MGKKTLVLIIAIIFMMTLVASAERSEMSEAEYSLGDIYLGDTLEKVQINIGELSFVKSWKPNGFPITFDTYEGRGIKLDVDHSSGRIFAITVTTEDNSTRSGVKVGDTVESVKNIYGSYRYNTTSIEQGTKRKMTFDNYTAMERMIITINLSNKQVEKIFVCRILD